MVVPVALLLRLRSLLPGRRIQAENQHLQELEAARMAAMQFVGHEIRTPLAMARGYLDMLKDGAFGPLSQEGVSIVAEVDLRLGEIEELAAQLIEAARAADTGMRLDLEPLDLRHLVKDAMGRSRSVSSNDDQVQLVGLDQPIAVKADRSRVLMVVRNLLENAIKYSPGGGRVLCTVESDARVGRVLVSDHGVGLDPEQVEQLFKPYSRLERTTALARPGLGLGLYLSREIARAHGGQLDAWPNPEGGSTFRLTLPLRQGLH
jgi:signal transduction histidine kinase